MLWHMITPCAWNPVILVVVVELMILCTAVQDRVKISEFGGPNIRDDGNGTDLGVDGWCNEGKGRSLPGDGGAIDRNDQSRTRDQESLLTGNGSGILDFEEDIALCRSSRYASNTHLLIFSPYP